MRGLLDSLKEAPGRALAVAVGTVVVAGVGVVVVRRLTAERPPPEDQWQRVGRLKVLDIFPLKSARSITLDYALATDAGICQGQLRDRVFVTVDRNGNAVTGRTHPRLFTVEVSVVRKAGNSLVYEFRSPHVENVLSLDPASLSGAPCRKVKVLHTSVSAADCGDAAAAWIRKAVVETKSHGEASVAADLRMAFFPMEGTDRAPNKTCRKNERGIYTDETSYHIVNAASVEELNVRLRDPITYKFFRPNFLVEGPKPFDEDDWTWVRIGEAVFKVVMPCGRCAMTTFNPEDGTKLADGEPLKTLRGFRQPRPFQKTQMGGSSAPVLGLHLAIHKWGKVSAGDDVFVVQEPHP